jgi:hypothetical protein
MAAVVGRRRTRWANGQRWRKEDDVRRWSQWAEGVEEEENRGRWRSGGGGEHCVAAVEVHDGGRRRRRNKRARAVVAGAGR